MNKNQNKSNIGGMFIYKNKNNQNVYYDIITKKAYIITKQDENKYSVFSSRLVMSISLSILITWLIKISIPFAILAGVALYVITTLIFRLKFLPSLVEDTKFIKPKRSNIFHDSAKTTPLNKMIVGCVIILVIIALSIIEIKTNGAQGQKLIGQIIIISVASLYLIFLLITIIVKLRYYKD